MKSSEFGTSSVESSDKDTDSTTEKSSTTTKKKSLRVPLAPPAPKPETTKLSDGEKQAASLFGERADVKKTETTDIEKPTSEEVQHAVQEIANEHLQAIEQVDEEAAEELAPAAEFLEKIQEGADPDAAFEQVAAELGMSEEEIAAALNEATEEDGATPESDDFEAAEFEGGAFDTDETQEQEIDLSQPTPQAAGGAGGSGGSGAGTPPPTPSPFPSLPPRPPVPPVQPVGPVGAPAAPQPAAANVAPATANILPPAANEYYYQRRRAGELLVIGLVGYLIGRRRGRIRTEKKLLPVQKKLEKQVRTLEQDITHKEQQLVAVKARRTEARQAVAATGRENAPPKTPVERTQPGRRETRLGMEKPARVERLGHMVVAAEAPQKTVERTKVERPNSIRQAFRPEEVRTMQRNELLELSEKIVVEGASLRRIYESRLIGEKQLRHLVSEYLQGKDIHKDLRHEMVEHEIDFERDPILRDRIRSHLENNRGGSGLSDMLAKAGLADDTDDPELERRIEVEQQRQAEQQRKQHRRQVVTDSALVTAIVVLAAAVLILALRG